MSNKTRHPLFKKRTQIKRYNRMETVKNNAVSIIETIENNAVSIIETIENDYEIETKNLSLIALLNTRKAPTVNTITINTDNSTERINIGLIQMLNNPKRYL